MFFFDEILSRDLTDWKIVCLEYPELNSGVISFAMISLERDTHKAMINIGAALTLLHLDRL